MNVGLYRFVAGVFGLWLRTVVRVRVVGREHVPRRGAVLFCINHRSWWDIPLAGSLLGRRVHFMAKTELFRHRVFAALIRSLGAFPVRRDEADRQAMRRALQVLAAGGAVGLFPEGHRSASGELGRGQAGAAYIALASAAPVVPVAIGGAYRRRGLTVRIGRPVDLEAHRGRRLRTAELAAVCDDAIMGAIAGLLGPEGAPGPDDARRGQEPYGQVLSEAVDAGDAAAEDVPSASG